MFFFIFQGLLEEEKLFNHYKVFLYCLEPEYVRKNLKYKTAT